MMWSRRIRSGIEELIISRALLPEFAVRILYFPASRKDTCCFRKNSLSSTRRIVFLFWSVIFNLPKFY